MIEAGPSSPVLVLLNGPPASGKSTLARLWSDVAQRLEVVDIDSLRRTLDDWPSDPERAGHQARRLALDIIAGHLAAGFSVVVPQFLGRAEFVHELASVAEAHAALFVECALTVSRQEAIAAFIERSDNPETPEHEDADVLVTVEHRVDRLTEMYEALTALISTRPTTRYIDVSRGDVPGTLARLRSVVPEV